MRTRTAVRLGRDQDGRLASITLIARASANSSVLSVVDAGRGRAHDDRPLRSPGARSRNRATTRSATCRASLPRRLRQEDLESGLRGSGDEVRLADASLHRVGDGSGDSQMSQPINISRLGAR